MVTGATPAASSAEVSFGLNGGGGYEAKMTRGREGNRPEAHRGCGGGLGELEEASGRAHGRRRSRQPKLEEEVGEAAAGRVRSCGLAGTV